MKELIARLEMCVDRLESIGEDHEARLRTLEARQYKIAGGLALAVFTVPLLLKFL